MMASGKQRLALFLVMVGIGFGALVAVPDVDADKPVEKKKDASKPAGKEKDPFGYTAAFDAELKEIGQITPQQFAKRYASKAEYLDKLSWDPTTAKFFKDYNADPANVRARGRYDFRLDPKELEAFKKNGFVVSERMGAMSFAEMYYRIYSRDLPGEKRGREPFHAPGAE